VASLVFESETFQNQTLNSPATISIALYDVAARYMMTTVESTISDGPGPTENQPAADAEAGNDVLLALPSDRQQGVEVQPDPSYVIKTRLQTSTTSLSPIKLFINVCSSEVIAKPSTKKRLDAEGEEIEGLNVPVSVGSLRRCTDKAGKPAKAIDVIVSPRIIHEENANSASDLPLVGGNRDFLNQFIMQCVEQKCNAPTPVPGGLPSNVDGAAIGGPVKIDRKYTLPKLSYQGYVDSFTGLSVDKKSSGFAEVAKQMVRDFRKQPVIEEVEPPRSTARETKQTSTGSSISSSEASTPTLPIECSMSIETADGTIEPLSEYAEAANASSGRGAVVMVDPALSAHSNKGSLLLINNASDSNSSTSSVQPKIVHIECQLISCPKPETIRVDVSACAVSVSSVGHNPTECILPLPVDTGSTTCSYNATSSILSIKATVVADDTIDCPDIGSHPWMLMKGLSSKKENNDNIGSKKKKKKEKQSTPRLQDQQKAGCLDDKGDEDIFPEDCFHAQDAYSQHMLLKQKEEQNGTSDQTAISSKKDAGGIMELF